MDLFRSPINEILRSALAVEFKINVEVNVYQDPIRDSTLFVLLHKTGPGRDGSKKIASFDITTSAMRPDVLGAILDRMRPAVQQYINAPVAFGDLAVQTAMLLAATETTQKDTIKNVPRDTPITAPTTTPTTPTATQAVAERFELLELEPSAGATATTPEPNQRFSLLELDLDKQGS